MSINKRLMINLIAGIMAFSVNVGISFFLTPYLVRQLGNEAFGFIGLSNNFVSYVSVITIALNSMAARFITIEIHNNEIEKANTYFNSLLLANGVIAGILAVVSVLIIVNLEKVIKISVGLVGDVKLTFTLVFITFLVTIITSVFSVATFVKNRVDLASVRQITANVIKVTVLLLFFLCFAAKIYYISAAALISAIFVAFSNFNFTKMLLPEIKINIHKFKFAAIKILISSGIWNSLNSLSLELLRGMDLLISNWFIGGEAMGILSIAKTIPTAIVSLLGMLAGVFAPIFTILYAKKDIEALVREVKSSIKVFSLLMIVPIAGFIAFGDTFFTLWLPTKTSEEIDQIQILSVLTLGPNLVSSYIYSLYSINMVTNKLKVPVILTMFLSVVNMIIVYILLKTTNMGLYAVAGVSSVILLVMVLTFVPMYAAHNLKLKLSTFYPPLIKALVTSGIILCLFFLIGYYFKISKWLTFITFVSIAGAIGYVLCYLLLLNKEEKQKVTNIIKRNLLRRKYK